MITAKVFQSGNSQAVRLPKEFRFASDEVQIFRRGNEVVLREIPRTLEDAFHALCDLELDESIRDTRPAQVREGL
jgi:antitoxin VapB